ncbi:MAG: methyltransferase, partial [Halobacteriovoraceae bacterium]|nr:methyltransferase [Halobacteriovoraceae bacterium]
MHNANLSNKLQKIANILNKYLPLISQSDLSVISGNEITHKWITQLMKLDRDDLVRFDAQKEHTLLNDPDWLQLIDDIEKLFYFKKTNLNEMKVKTFGNVKKQHELKQLYSFMSEDVGKSVTDFGGGVGNLAYFLEGQLEMKVNVLEKDMALIEKGKKKLSKLNSQVTFNQCHVCSSAKVPNIANGEVAIGLHTCGNFATDMFRTCIENKTQKIINFGCCYSKIKNHDYNLSGYSDKSIILNERALASATQSFNKVPCEFYDYRERIMEFKLSFHHWLFAEYSHLGFCSMSNARTSLYKNTFSGYVEICLKKFFPEFPTQEQSRIEHFYKSERNTFLN